MDLTIKNNVAAAAKANQPVLSLTTRRNLVSGGIPMIFMADDSSVFGAYTYGEVAIHFVGSTGYGSQGIQGQSSACGLYVQCLS